MTNPLYFSTRSVDGITQEYTSIDKALENFLSSDGYRLDFNFPDGRVLFVHRGEYGDDIPEEKLNHPAYKNFKQAVSKVLYYLPDGIPEDKDNSNVIHLDFGS